MQNKKILIKRVIVIEYIQIRVVINAGILYILVSRGRCHTYYTLTIV